MAEAEAPTWLGAAFVQDVFWRNGDADAGAAATSVTATPVGVAGDHYGSAMYRVATPPPGAPLIVKTLPPGDGAKRIIRESGTFPRETLMLSRVVPAMQRILALAAEEPRPAIAPRCLHHGDDPEEFIVMEDLAPLGFRLADRHRGLGLRHCLLTLRTLARFHAASAFILRRDPSLLATLNNPYVKQSFRDLVPKSFQNIADGLRQCPDFPEDWPKSVELLSEGIYERFVSINDYVPGRFNVITHGDFWTNNMMFRYEDGEVREVRFVDFQFSRVTTPAADLLYFLYSSVSEDVSERHVDLLLREYHVALAAAARALTVEVPTLEEFLEDIQDNALHAVLATFGILPITKTEQVPDFEKTFGDDAHENNFMLTSPTVRRWFRRLIPEFQRKGWLPTEK